MPTVRLQTCYVKYISQCIDDTFEADTVSLLNRLSSEENTPILYTIMKVWRLGQTICISDSCWYKACKILPPFIKRMPREDVFELLRININGEIWSCGIYPDLAEKLCVYATFLYAALYDSEIIEPLRKRINTEIQLDECVMADIQIEMKLAMEATN